MLDVGRGSAGDKSFGGADVEMLVKSGCVVGRNSGGENCEADKEHRRVASEFAGNNRREVLNLRIGAVKHRLSVFYRRDETDLHHCRRKNYFAVTSECVMAWTESAMRFCTPTLRISFATCAFTVRSSMPRAEPISLLERPATSISSTSFSRSVKVMRPAGKIRPGDALTRSMKVESTRRGAHTEP